MQKRPTSVTVIVWINLIFIILSLVLTILIFNFPHNFPYNINRMKQIPLSISAQHLINFTFNIIFLISLTACLMGRNWARYLFLIVTLINISLGISLELVTPHPVYRSFWVICFSVVFGFIFYLITIFYLFRSKASAYFTGRGAISAE